MEQLEVIKDDSQEILALIIKRDFLTEGIKFFTPPDFSQQLAYMNHKKGKKIKPHTHNALLRKIHFTQEVLLIKSGKLKVDIYGNDQTYLCTCILNAGDVILFASGGHGFETLEDTEMIEVKQGPYAGDKLDKTHFEAQE